MSECIENFAVKTIHKSFRCQYFSHKTIHVSTLSLLTLFPLSDNPLSSLFSCLCQQLLGPVMALIGSASDRLDHSLEPGLLPDLTWLTRHPKLDVHSVWGPAVVGLETLPVTIAPRVWFPRHTLLSLATTDYHNRLPFAFLAVYNISKESDRCLHPGRWRKP